MLLLNTRRLFLSNQRVVGAAQSKAAKNLVETKSSEQAVNKTTQAKTAQQLANQAKDTVEQQTNGSNDLAERLH